MLLFLQIRSDATAIGLFAVALTLSNLATQGPLMLTWGLLPKLSEQFARRGYGKPAEELHDGHSPHGASGLPGLHGSRGDPAPAVAPIIWVRPTKGP